MRACFLLLLLLVPLFELGCVSSPSTPMGVVRVQSNTLRRGQVYLLRGWQGLWSQGIDDLSKELTADGVNAHVFYQGQTSELGDTLLARYRGLPDGTAPDP